MECKQYMRDLQLMKQQYGGEEELYPLVNILLREGENMNSLSIRDVHEGKGAKNTVIRKYIDGWGSFPDIAIFDERFGSANIDEVENLKYIYGCVEVKKEYPQFLKDFDEVCEFTIKQQHKNESIYQAEYERCGKKEVWKLSRKKNGRATDAG